MTEPETKTQSSDDASKTDKTKADAPKYTNALEQTTNANSPNPQNAVFRVPEAVVVVLPKNAPASITLNFRQPDSSWLFPTKTRYPPATAKAHFPQGSQRYPIATYQFRVFGNVFEGANAGPNWALADRLESLQRVLYSICRDEFGRAVDEDEFLDWLWKDQFLTTDKTPDQSRASGRLQQHKATHNSGGNTFHTTGSAVDINYDRNPYVPVRHLRGISGEKYYVSGPDKQKPLLNGLIREALHKKMHEYLWPRCCEIYDRAVGFIYGDLRANMDLPWNRQTETATRADVEKTVKAYARVSQAVREYFQLVYPVTATAVATPLNSAVLLAKLDLDKRLSNPDPTNVGLSSARTVDERLKMPSAAGAPLGPDGFVGELYRTILKDYATLRLVMEMGDLYLTDDGLAKNPNELSLADFQVEGMSRFPQHGFLNLRQEFVIEACAPVDAVGEKPASERKLFWGGFCFGTPGGNGNGDMQHFELPTKNLPPDAAFPEIRKMLPTDDVGALQ